MAEESRKASDSAMLRVWGDNSPILILGLLTVSALLVAAGRGNWQVIILWSGVFFFSGALLGFLFGIPGGRPQREPVAESREAVNSNLEQVADWLTKMLVGIVLINLKDLPVQLGNLTRYVASALDGRQSDEPFVTALVFYFGTTGFLAGFLGCRMSFRILSSESGAKAVARLADGLETTLIDRIERAMRGPVLVNYEGYFCVALWESGVLLKGSDSSLRLSQSDGELDIRIWLQQEPPLEAYTSSVPVSIRGGEDRDNAEFEVRADADHFKLDPSRKTVTVSNKGTSERLAFRAKFKLDSTEPPLAEGDGPGDRRRLQHPLWLMLYQQNRLIQTITCDFGAQQE